MSVDALVRADIAAMAGYVPGEQPSDGRLVKLNTNENPYPPSPRVVDAIRAEAGPALARYPTPASDAVRERAARVYGLDASQVLIGNGSDELLSIVLRACVEPGQTVAYPVPTYSLYRTLAALAGAEIVEVPAPAGVVPDGLPATDARVTFLCTPGSPVGRSLGRDDLSAYADAARGVVVIDEAYADFADGDALELVDRHDNVVVTRPFSKSFSLAGLRLGLAFASTGLVSHLAKVKDSYNVSRLSAAAGAAALDDVAWMRSNVARVRATRERVAAQLRDRGLAVEPSDANFLWIDIGHPTSEQVYRGLRERGVLVRYFDSVELRHGLRVSVGSDADMDRFVEALDQSL